jgi:hypothetical protein
MNEATRVAAVGSGLRAVEGGGGKASKAGWSVAAWPRESRPWRETAAIGPRCPRASSPATWSAMVRPVPMISTRSSGPMPSSASGAQGSATSRGSQRARASAAAAEPKTTPSTIFPRSPRARATIRPVAATAGGGSISWNKICEHVPSRTGKQCRERWFNHLTCVFALRGAAARRGARRAARAPLTAANRRYSLPPAGRR